MNGRYGGCASPWTRLSEDSACLECLISAARANPWVPDTGVRPRSSRLDARETGVLLQTFSPRPEKTRSASTARSSPAWYAAKRPAASLIHLIKRGIGLVKTGNQTFH